MGIRDTEVRVKAARAWS